jgi:hypothetical protein
VCFVTAIVLLLVLYRFFVQRYSYRPTEVIVIVVIFFVSKRYEVPRLSIIFYSISMNIDAYTNNM